MASEPASHVKLVIKQMFGRASPEAAREAAREALPKRASVVARAQDSQAFDPRRSCAVRLQSHATARRR